MCPVSQSPVHRRQWIYKICERVGNSPSIGNVDQGIDVNAIKKFYLKDNEKDPKLIANLVKDGNFGMPYGKTLCRYQTSFDVPGSAE